MTKIGVISDTHLMAPTRELAALVEKGRVFSGCDMILHCGDITAITVLDAFYPKKVVAVKGNMDGINAPLPMKEIVKIEDFSIGLIHGWGSRHDLESRLIPEFEGIDVLCYGHTHTAANYIRDGLLLFNPGSFMDGSVGILTIDREKGISGRIIAVL